MPQKEVVNTVADIKEVIQMVAGNDFFKVTPKTDFATGLRQALRENQDIILVGEMRDRSMFIFQS